MICENFDLLTHKEKVEYIGRLVHSVQSDNQLFSIGKEIIRQAEQRGVLDDVIINPDTDNSSLNHLNELP